MDIGLIIYGRLDTLTGGYIYDRILVEHLRRRGHRVDVISLPPALYARQLLDNFSKKLLLRLVSADCELLLQDGLNHPSLFRMNHRLRAISNIPTVALVHQVKCRQPRNSILNRLYEAVERPYLDSVDAFIFNSVTTRRTVERLTGRRQPSIVAFPAGDRLGCLASADQIGSRARSPGPLRLIFVGNVLPNKGLLPLLQALRKLSCQTWHLTVVGSLDMHRRYVRQVKKLIAAENLQHQAALVGPRDGPELASLLSRSHIFVMPYSHEGFGMAHLEAMGFGLPVVGSAGGAVKEYVIPEQNGYLIEPGDGEKTAVCLKQLDGDRQLLIKLSRAALQTFHKHPRWIDTVKAVDRFLIDLTDRKGNT